MCQGITVKKIDIICTFIECGVRKPFVLKGLKFKNMEIKMESVKEKTMNYFTIIPSEIENDDRLTHGAKYLYGKIKALSTKEGFCWASNKYLAKITKASVSSIKRWKNILVNIGYIKSEIIYKGETKEVAGRKMALTDLNRGGFNLNRGVGSNLRTNNINNNNINYYSKKERNLRARASKNSNSGYVDNSTNDEINKTLEKIQSLEKYLDNLKNISQASQESKFVDVPNQQLSEATQDYNEPQVAQDFEYDNESNSQLMEEYPNCIQIQAEKESEDIDTPDLTSKYSEIFDIELKNKYSCEEIKMTQQDNYTESEIKNSRNSCSRSMELYGRESFDEITARKISDSEERVKLGKILAFDIRRHGYITNDSWSAKLDRHLSLSDSVKERLANLDYSLAGGYSNIFSAPKNEFSSKTQYASISIFE